MSLFDKQVKTTKRDIDLPYGLEGIWSQKGEIGHHLNAFSTRPRSEIAKTWKNK